MRTCFTLLLASSLFACGGDDTGTDTGTDSGTGTDTETGADMGEDAPPPGNGVAFDDFFESDCDPSCRDEEVETGCGCVVLPTTDEFASNLVGCGQLTTEGEPRTPEDDFCVDGAGDAAPNLSCMMPGMYLTAAASEPVTMYGVVDVFGNGGDAEEILVEVYAEGPEGALGDLLGSATASIEDPCAETEVQFENDLPVDERQLGFYVIENIPSETPLIVRTSGRAGFWRDIYSYNVVAVDNELEREAPADDACETLRTAPEFDGTTRWDFRARILSDSDWTSIPLTAGLTEGVRAMSGVVAGEIHDCDDIRLEFAQVGTWPRAEILTFFNDNPDNPLPSVGRTEGTSLLGLFAALDVPAGPVDVAAVGRVGGEDVSLGWYRARVFEGAVTTVTLRGLRAHQVPAE